MARIGLPDNERSPLASLSRASCEQIEVFPQRETNRMTPFLFRCPNTSQTVQGFVAEEVFDDPNTYESVTCLACRQVHLVNPPTGKVLGADEE